MGCAGSKTVPATHTISAVQKGNNRTIEERLLRELEDEKRIIKCLILGAGECGKSTILKQMKILHLNGFSPDEKKGYLRLIHKNTLESIQTLVAACQQLQIPLDSPASEKLASSLMEVNNSQEIPISLKQDIGALWHDQGIRKAYARSNEFHLLDSAQYFLDALDRTFNPTFAPTQQDILRARQATTGIIQTDFTIDKLQFKMFDVGGQRGERKKWIHCFHSVTAIMYIASLSEYDQVLAEDRTRNRLKESLDLFEGIINLPWFKDAPIILFLNKNDIFIKKIGTVDIGIYFPNYTGGCDYDAGLKFIQEEYFQRNENELKTIYCHVTDATNTENIAFVWKCTKHIILEQNLTRSGLLMC